MQKLGISLFFFTLSCFIVSASFAQSPYPFSGHLTFNADSLLRLGDSIGGPLTIADSTFKKWNFKFPNGSIGPSRHYFSKNGERYYLDIIPPKQKSKRVHGSDVWLLGAK